MGPGSIGSYPDALLQGMEEEVVRDCAMDTVPWLPLPGRAKNVHDMLATGS